ncbi:MAG: NADH-quinone oxidoreductase subunit H [Nitrososphaerota archaeon]|nr:NADH-quinone oxidoreductase subunit H [Nitrososphaerota archaeon]
MTWRGIDAESVRLVLGALQVVLIIALAPLLTGIMRKVKARTQKRVGASVTQPYYDLSKLLKKDEVISDQASWVFSSAPWVIFAATVTASLFVPAFVPFSPFSVAGDILVVIGLLALARFFTMLAGLDVASAFGGLGSSREMMISSLAEPALFLTIFVVSLTLGGTNLTSLVGAAAQLGTVIAPSMLFGLLAFFVVILAETGRLPFDNPATHLELTMVHEAMLLEYSGRGLAFIEWSQSVKQMIMLSLLVNLFIPVGMPLNSDAGIALPLALGAVAFVAKIMTLSAIVAYVETRVAKWRLFRLPDLLAMAIASAMVGVILHYL